MHICLLQTKIGKAPERIKTCCPGAILNDSSVSLFEHILNRLVLTWARVEYPSAFLRTKKPCRPPRRIQTFLHFTDENSARYGSNAISPPCWAGIKIFVCEARPLPSADFLSESLARTRWRYFSRHLISLLISLIRWLDSTSWFFPS